MALPGEGRVVGEAIGYIDERNYRPNVSAIPITVRRLSRIQ